MSAAEIIEELPKLSETEHRAVLDKLLALEDRLQESAVAYRAVNLRERGIDEAQAADLRARLKTFAEDWDRPEAAIFDEDSPR